MSDQQPQQPTAPLQPIQQPTAPLQPIQQPQQPTAPLQPIQQPQQPQQPTAPLQPIQQPQQPQQLGGFNVGNMSVQDANDSIIAQLQAQNAALIEQNNNLNAQVVRMVQNGAQFVQQPQQPQQAQTQQVSYPFNAQNPAQFQYAPVYNPDAFMPSSLAQDVDMSLESLAKEIGKKPQ